MVAFHIALENPWVLKTWDRSMIPRPFSQGLMRISRRIQVPGDIQDSERDTYHAQLQQALDRVRDFSETNVHKAGSKEFPYCDARA